MLNKKQITYQFPNQIQREYYQLMNSQNQFSKNLSNADQHRLEILYGELRNAWNRNNIDKLNNILNQKYNELRILQRELFQNKKTIEESVEKIGNQKIKMSWEKLETRKSNLKVSKENLKKKIIQWKEDIDQENILLEKKKEELKMNQISFLDQMEELNLNLNQQLTKMKELEEELKKILIEEERTLSEFAKQKINLGLSLNSIKLKNQEESNRLENELKKNKTLLTKEEAQYQDDFKKMQASFKENLKLEQEKLVKKYIQENPIEISSFPIQIIDQLKDGNYLMISKTVTQISKEQDQLIIALKRELTKIGKTEEWFFKHFDKQNNLPR